MDDNLSDLKTDETAQEDISNLDKLTQSYLLLKKKIAGTHELIKKYNDKTKKCERLKQELDTASKAIKETTYNYNSTLAKIIKLELQNTEYKKSIETLTTQVNEANIKAAADQQHIQQLICKIKDTEEDQNHKIIQYDLEKSSLQVRIKELEQELKNVKKSYDTKMKKMEKKISVKNEDKAKLQDVGTNTSTRKTIMQNPEVTDKSVLTDNFYNVKDVLYPIFCDNCDVLLHPPPLEKICTIMSNSCPKLVEKIPSPPKRSPSPLQSSIDIRDGQRCKTETLLTLSDTSSQHLPNQNNRVEFIPTSLLTPHTISLGRSDYCNTFPPTSNLIDPSTYYIGSTPLNPLSRTDSNTTNQNNHCENMVTPTLSIILSLQKRIDMLEMKMKMKEKLNKKGLNQNHSCCQHHHLNACSMYDINNSTRFNFNELRKLMDAYRRKETKKFNGHKTLRKLSRLKCKRLQNVYTGFWKIESIVNKTERTSLKKKLKKSKYRNSFLRKSDNLLHSTEDIEELTGDSKTNINVESKSILRIRRSSLSLNSDHTNRNEAEAKIVRNLVECSKSVGGETDSGILSDSIESGKLIRSEANTDTYSALTEHKSAIEIKSSMENESCSIEHIKPVNESPIKVVHVSHLVKLDKSIEKTNTLNTDMSETPQSDRKRKISESEIKKSVIRPKLLEKIKNLKKNSKIMKTCQNVLEHQDMQNYEHENGNISKKQEGLDNNSQVVKKDDYIPKKKSRIAHVPKNTMIKQKKLNNVPKFKKQLIKDLENANCTDLNELKEDNNELQKICGNNIQETQLISSKVHSSSTENIVGDAVHEIPITDIKNLSSNVRNKTCGQDTNITFKTNSRYSLFDTTLNTNSLEGVIKLNEKKTDSNKNDEHLKHVCEINSLDVREINKTNSTSKQELLNFNDKSSTDTSEINDISERNLCTKEITRTNVCITQEDSAIEHELKSYCLLKILQKHINNNPSKKDKKMCNKKLLHIGLMADEFVSKQLQRLIDNDWQNSIHWDVIEKLKFTCSSRIIAKGIIEFLSTEQEHNSNLDNSYTPPAPLMTKAQQRISALLIDLEKSMPTVFQFVQVGIEYKLFRLNQGIERYAIESLARMYTVLARIKKDREKVRIFCCDALYCLGVHAILILYTVLTSWPEVFPNNETSTNRLLPKCMAHLIMAQQAMDYPKLYALKNLVSMYYKYPMGTLSKDLLKELLTALQERNDSEAEIAIILLAKREGTRWTHTNIIKGALLSMIINEKFPSTYRAFSLLGNLMRVFPIEDKDNLVGQIVEQLCDLINSDKGSDEQKEGVFSALLSLSRHKFDEVIQNTLKWTPSMPLHDRTMEQISGLFNTRDPDFWRAYLRKNKQLFVTLEENKT
ncbi:uncharacterized protein LOC117242744 [Bombus vosnesenskii]|uniref:Uncharacterized protein LOC117242744 n=1 Tax=Bombus vosnesenskii TaxID=207650 RepID=A0A6J3LNM9_9HYME|nr:uncharacterized protein LOC117242744 [Bombus vosnesenskii]XP_033365544.1 uncharacterized protein LOC117242744 [Bombus vosnesenskii]